MGTGRVSHEHMTLLQELEIPWERAREILLREGYGVLSPRRWLRRMAPDQLRSMEGVYIPHWFCRFRLGLIDPGREVVPAASVLVNALSGECGQLLEAPRLVEHPPAALAQALYLEPTVSRERAIELATRAQRWQVFLKGRDRLAAFRVEFLDCLLGYVPFWVGYFRGEGGQVRVKTLHGITGTIEKHTLTREILRGLARIPGS